MRLMFSLAFAIALALTTLQAQTPAPVLVQAAPPAAAPAAQAAPVTTTPSAALPLLQALKAANAETLKKQEATLVQLDELQKAADQIKIYTKRG